VKSDKGFLLLLGSNKGILYYRVLIKRFVSYWNMAKDPIAM
jgi:hypothetical protein